MKNIVVLYCPPFRNVTFPVHIIQNLKEYRFFILLIEADFDHNKKFIELDCIENVIPLKFEIDHLVSVCDEITTKYGIINNFIYLAEECVRLCGMLRKHYGISPENLDRFLDKDLMVEKLRGAGVRVPMGVLFDDAKYQQDKEKYLQEIEYNLSQYPFFIKPSNLCGSVGTSIVANRDELINWVQQKANHSYLIQEYLDGKLFHCESFIKNRQTLYSSVFEYSTPGFFFSKGSPVGSISLPANDLLAQRISRFTENVLQKLGTIENGVAHVEIFLNRDDELIFLEAAARPPGLAGDLLYQKHLNIPINEAHLLLQLGEYNYDFSKLKIHNYAARYIFPIPSDGCITKFSNKIKINSAFTESFLIKTGDEVRKSSDLFNVAGTMVLWNKDYAALRKDFIALKDCIPFEIQEI